MATFVIFPDKQRKWRWHLKANNGLIIADSGQGYASIADCKHGIELVKTLAPNAKVDYDEPLKQAITMRKALTAVAARRKPSVRVKG